MAQINKPDEYFNTVPYSGTSASHSVSVGFQPDLVWLKPRSVVDNHRLMNSVSGAGFYLMSNANNGESASGTRFTSFDADGFTLGDADSGWNQSGQTYASWNWLASNTTASNTDGSITSTVSANTTSGFSIVSFTATGSTATVGHGLGSAPKVVIIKDRDAIGNWYTYHESIGNTKAIYLDLTNAESGASSNFWNNTSPTTDVFSIGSAFSANAQIAYCFAEKKGFSKFGSYTGNGNSDGTFIYTGFKPAWVLFKRTSSTSNWSLFDNKRDTFNINNSYVQADTSATEQEFSDVHVDFLSNGIKQRGTNISLNSSGDTFIYMAFAESPLVGTNNIPAVAR